MAPDLSRRNMAISASGVLANGLPLSYARARSLLSCLHNNHAGRRQDTMCCTLRCLLILASSIDRQDRLLQAGQLPLALLDHRCIWKAFGFVFHTPEAPRVCLPLWCCYGQTRSLIIPAIRKRYYLANLCSAGSATTVLV